jgi:hypothetical protein
MGRKATGHTEMGRKETGLTEMGRKATGHTEMGRKATGHTEMDRKETVRTEKYNKATGHTEMDHKQQATRVSLAQHMDEPRVSLRMGYFLAEKLQPLDLDKTTARQAKNCNAQSCI